MALLYTGSSKDNRIQFQEKGCPEELCFDFGTFDTHSISAELDISYENSPTEQDIVSLDTGVNLLDQVNSAPFVSGSSVHSPLSDCSSDSGVLGSAVCEEDQFLTGLFGSDFPLFHDSPLDCSPSPSNPEQSILPINAIDAKSRMPRVSSAPKNIDITVDSKLDSLAEKSRKNAESARQNRIKKKKHLEDLEKERSTLKTENVILKTKCRDYFNKWQKVQSEVEYLKNVLANESVLSSLIKNIPNVPNVKLSSSFSSRKRPNADKSSSASKKQKTQVEMGGICLHVVKDQVSLEFCQNCSKLASLS